MKSTSIIAIIPGVWQFIR